MKLGCWTISLIGAIYISGTAAPLAAQNLAKADALYQEGVKRLEAGQYEAACPMLRESYELDPAAGTLFALADCHAFVGEIATAVRRYEEYLRLVDAMPADRQAKQVKTGRVTRAQAQFRVLLPDVPRVSFEFPREMPPGTRVEQDGVDLNLGSPNNNNMSLSVDPGEHIVRVIVPGKEAVETRFSLNKGESKSVRLQVPALEVFPTNILQSARKPSNDGGKTKRREISGMRLGAYILGIPGSVGLGISALLGGFVLKQSGDLLERCPRNEGTGKLVCPTHEDSETLKHWQRLGTASTVGVAISGTAMIGAGILLMLEPEAKEKNKNIGQLHLDIFSVDSKGALMGVRGVW